MRKTEKNETIKEEAMYIIRTGCTVREGAKVYNVSKSTFYNDVAVELPKIDMHLWEKVKAVLLKNKAERHIRGGMATRRKYQKAKEI